MEPVVYKYTMDQWEQSAKITKLAQQVMENYVNTKTEISLNERVEKVLELIDSFRKVPDEMLDAETNKIMLDTIRSEVSKLIENPVTLAA